MLGDTVELYLAAAGVDLQDFSPSYYSDSNDSLYNIPRQSQEIEDRGFSSSVPFQFAQYLQEYDDNPFLLPPLPCGFSEYTSEVPFDIRANLSDRDQISSSDYDQYYQGRRGSLGSLNSFPGAPSGIFTVNLTVTNDTSLTFMGLCPFTTYNFSVSAVNTAGGGPYAQASATTFEDGAFCVCVCVCVCVCMCVCGVVCVA